MGSVPEAAIRVVALTPRGASLAREISRGLAGARCWLPRALAGGESEEQTFDRVATVFGEAFRQGRESGGGHGGGHRGAQHRPASPGQSQGPRR